MVRYPRDYIFSNHFKETGEINLKLIIAWQHHSLTSSRSALWSWLLSGDSGSILFAASWNQKSQLQWLAVNSLISVPQAEREGGCFLGSQWLTPLWEGWEAEERIHSCEVGPSNLYLLLPRSFQASSGLEATALRGVVVTSGRKSLLAQPKALGNHLQRWHLDLPGSEGLQRPPKALLPWLPRAVASWESFVQGSRKACFLPLFQLAFLKNGLWLPSGRLWMVS